ncbi:amidohydrolase family protein [Sinorhizobium meliloti]|uniref:amidohydrolase family protein n=1 Tax=Rhizobium meliloti TaxID=382 RepID=UPI0013E2ECCC|nr:amidohydrolase family protein [Sinorhizobium meliloti]
MNKQTLITDAVIIDGTAGLAQQNKAILIENGMITAVGSVTDLRSVAEGADIMALPGRYIVPGFINVHEHVLTRRARGSASERAGATRDVHLYRALRNAFGCLAEGFTTIRDAGSMDCLGLDVKKALNDGVFVGPRMQAVSQGLTVTGGYAHQFFKEVDSEVEVRKAVGEMIKRGVDWVKCMASIEWSKAEGEPISAVNISTAFMREAFDIAHHHGKRCMVHAVCKESIINSLDAGVDSVEHGVMLDEIVAERMAKDGVYLVPTISGWCERQNDWGRDAGHVRHANLMRPYHDRSVQIAHSLGVKMAYGSDNFGNLVDEVRALQEAGMTLSDCLILATRNGAELLGINDMVGTIEQGKRADLVVLGSDPLESAEAFGDVHLVFRDGRKIDPNLLPI